MDKALIDLEIGGRRADLRGKVREIFDLGDRLLIVATDRLSAYDCVLPTGIPGKGRILTRLSAYWFRALAGVMNTHFLTDRVEEFPAPFSSHRALLAGRSMLVRKARRLDVECVVRGYLAGSGWTDYQAAGSVCGVSLPSGLLEAEKLPAPIFTPASKNDSGHEENITREEAMARSGPLVEEAALLSLRLYKNLSACAERRRIILADTKFEFGVIDGGLALIDEVASPDSSRFWDPDHYAPGRSPASFDKQYVRDWLTQSGWNRRSPAPALPDDVVERTRERYEEAARRLIDDAHPLVFSEFEGTWI